MYLGTYRVILFHTSPVILGKGDAVRWTSSIWCTRVSRQILLLRVDSYFLLGSLSKNITAAAFSAVASPLPALSDSGSHSQTQQPFWLRSETPHGRSSWASQQDTLLSASLIFFLTYLFRFCVLVVKATNSWVILDCIAWLGLVMLQPQTKASSSCLANYYRKQKKIIFQKQAS